MSLGDIVGDLGCPGIDVEAFKARCRVPIYPEQWNRWFLWRTDRDNPSPLDIDRSAVAVLGKWFELVEQPSGLSWPGKGTGKVDNVSVRVVPWDWGGEWGKVVARREQCGPVPMLKAGSGAIGVTLEFVYRGTNTSMPWPLHQVAVLGSYCPIGADWLLVRAYAPPAAPVPKEKGAMEEAGEAVRKVARSILPNPIGIVVFALAGLGVVAISNAIRGKKRR